MATATVATQPGVTLKKLESIVQQQEGIFGPLLSIGNGAGRNVLEFKIGASPRARAVLKLAGGGKSGAGKGVVLVCEGECLISGRKTAVSAYRGK